MRLTIQKAVSLFWLLLLCVVLLWRMPALAGDFSASIADATGWGTTDLSMYGDSSGTIPAKEPFRILARTGNDELQVMYNGNTGYISTCNVMINLPDVEPEIIYNLTNATGSIFTASTERGVANRWLSLYGTQIYYNGDTGDYYDSDPSSRAGKVWDKKIGRYEFVVPVLFSAAEKISSAGRMAAADGYRLKIYDAYRPNTATKLMNTSFNNLYRQTGGSLRLGGYDTSFFVAAALSSHNIGCAIDVTLSYGNYEADMPTKMHVLSGDAALLSYAGGMRVASELSGRPYEYYANNFAGNMTDEAAMLCYYMINSGMTGLGSEWWHFQDQSAYTQNRGYYTNLATWYPTYLSTPADNLQVSEVVTKRGEAVYQLWAAAGFPGSSGEVPFTDVTMYDYCYNAVCWAVESGIIDGSSSTTFSPNDGITRAGYLNMLYKYCQSPAEWAYGENAFADVSENAWYYNALQWAAGTGIADPTERSFRPSSILTQEQMHIFLTNAVKAGVPLCETYI